MPFEDSRELTQFFSGVCVWPDSMAVLIPWVSRVTYGIEIADGEDDVVVLCAAIVIDQVLHDEKK